MEVMLYNVEKVNDHQVLVTFPADDPTHIKFMWGKLRWIMMDAIEYEQHRLAMFEAFLSAALIGLTFGAALGVAAYKLFGGCR